MCEREREREREYTHIFITWKICFNFLLLLCFSWFHDWNVCCRICWYCCCLLHKHFILENENENEIIAQIHYKKRKEKQKKEKMRINIKTNNRVLKTKWTWKKNKKDTQKFRFHFFFLLLFLLQENLFQESFTVYNRTTANSVCLLYVCVCMRAFVCNTINYNNSNNMIRRHHHHHYHAIITIHWRLFCITAAIVFSFLLQLHNNKPLWKW